LDPPGRQGRDQQSARKEGSTTGHTPVFIYAAARRAPVLSRILHISTVGWGDENGPVESTPGGKGGTVKHEGRVWLATAVAIGLMWGTPTAAAAQADEIQVYDGGLAAPGVFNLTLHNNWTPRGIKTPAEPGQVVADKSLNGVPEWAYGVTSWFEAGLYLPLYTRDKNLGWGLNGFKLRTLFAVPHAEERTFFYGANMEFSFNADRWDSTKFTSEVRPIIGWHAGRVDVIFNPIVDTAYDGLKNLEFVPASRVAYNLSPVWAVAVEEYADFGPLHDLHSAHEQAHQIYGVLNRTGRPFDVELGIGFGLTNASDGLTLKVILARDLNKKR
jgi:hypothetical protein